MESHFIAAIDFDGTIVRHDFPRIGAPVPGAIKWLKRFQSEGMKLILWTMRCRDGSLGDVLTPAVQYCYAQGVEFWGINQNFQQCETQWSTSHKQYAHVYVDDAAAGTPLIQPEYPGVHNECRDSAHLPYVDWSLIGPNVMARYAFWKGWQSHVGKAVPDAAGGGVYTIGPDAPQVELPEPTMVAPG